MVQVRASMPILVSVCQEQAKTPTAPVFIDGKKAMTLRGEKIAEEFQEIVNEYVEQRYAQ